MMKHAQANRVPDAIIEEAAQSYRFDIWLDGMCVETIETYHHNLEEVEDIAWSIFGPSAIVRECDA